MSETVLVSLVEDDQAARQGLSGILEMPGYSVVAVGTGEEAVDIDERVPFSVVLTDFMLPGMPGIEVVQKPFDMAVLGLCVLSLNPPMLRSVYNSGCEQKRNGSLFVCCAVTACKGATCLTRGLAVGLLRLYPAGGFDEHRRKADREGDTSEPCSCNTT